MSKALTKIHFVSDAEARRALESASKNLVKDACDAEVKSLLELVCAMEKSKQNANELFNRGSVSKAMDKYTEALLLCPWANLYNARLLSNRGACHLKLGDYAKVVADCSAALDLSPTYVKALLHRVCACPRPKAPYPCEPNVLCGALRTVLEGCPQAGPT